MRSSSFICLVLCSFIAACSSPKASSEMSPVLRKDDTVSWNEKGMTSATEAQKNQVPLKQVSNIKTVHRDDAVYIGGSGYLQDDSLAVRLHRYQIVQLKSPGVWLPVLELNYGPTEPNSMLFQRLLTFAVHQGEIFVLRETGQGTGQVYKVGPLNSLIKFGPEYPSVLWPKIEMGFSSRGELWVGSFSGDEGSRVYRLKQDGWTEVLLPNITTLTGMHVDGDKIYVYGVRERDARVFRWIAQDRWELVFESGYISDEYIVSSVSFSAMSGNLSLAVLYSHATENKSLSRFYAKSAQDPVWENASDEVFHNKNMILQGVLSTSYKGAYGLTSSWRGGVKVNMLYWFKDRQELIANRFALGEPAGADSNSTVVFQNHLYFLHHDRDSASIVMSDFGPLRY